MDKDKQIEILEKRVKWLERKVGQLEYENHVQDEEYMSLGGALNNERMEHAKLQKGICKAKKGICQDGGRKRKAEQADVLPPRGYVMGVKIKNRMETRYIEISLETAKRWYEQGGELKDMALGAYSEQELVGSRLPKTWQEFCEQNEVKIGECYFDDCCFLIESDVDGNTRDIVNDRNILPSKQAAKQHLALMQLHQLRDYYREGWLPNGLSDVHGIEMYYDPSNGVVKVRVIKSRSISMFLSFQTGERAKEFLTNFRELIEEAWDLI